MTSSFVTITLNPAIDHTIFLDQLVAGKVNLAQRSQLHPGGKGINVAACLADAGMQTCALGLLGAANCRLFTDLFDLRQIHDDCTRLPGQTRTNLKIVEPSGLTTDINLAGLPADPSHLNAVSTCLRKHASANTVVVLAGSLPPGLDADSWARLLDQAHSQGARVIIDTSGPALHAAVQSQRTVLPFAIKPNRHELETLLGYPLSDRASIHSAAQNLVQRGIFLVVVSMGTEGALFVTEEQTLIARPTRFARGSSVGAGDAMVAGLASTAMQPRFDLEYCARQATGFSLSFLESGDQRRISPEQIDTLAREAVTIEPLAPPSAVSLL